MRVMILTRDDTWQYGIQLTETYGISPLPISMIRQDIHLVIYSYILLLAHVAVDLYVISTLIVFARVGVNN